MHPAFHQSSKYSLDKHLDSVWHCLAYSIATNGHVVVLCSIDYAHASQIRISPSSEDVELIDVPLKGRNMWQGAWYWYRQQGAFFLPTWSPGVSSKTGSDRFNLMSVTALYVSMSFTTWHSSYDYNVISALFFVLAPAEVVCLDQMELFTSFHVARIDLDSSNCGFVVFFECSKGVTWLQLLEVSRQAGQSMSWGSPPMGRLWKLSRVKHW